MLMKTITIAYPYRACRCAGDCAQNTLHGWRAGCYYSYSPNEETEAQRGRLLPFCWIEGHKLLLGGAE